MMIRFAFRHMKIRSKIAMIISLIVLVTFGISIVLQQYAFSVYDGQLYDKSSAVLNMSSASIETELKRIEQVSYNIIADAQMQKLLLAIKNSTSEYDRHLLHQDVVDRLIGYIGSEPSIFSIQLYDSPLGFKHDAGVNFAIAPDKVARIKRETSESKGETRWFYPDANDPALIAAREIRSFSTTRLDLQYLGTLAFRINIDQIVHKHAGEAGDLMIVAGGETIYPTKPAFDPELLEASMKSPKGYFKQSIGGKTYFVSHIVSSKTGWTYVNATPFNEIFKQVIWIKEMVAATFAVLLVGVVLLGYRFSRTLTRPMEDLMGRMKLAEKGSFEEAHLLPSDDAPPGMDEIGLLHRTFRLMIERIRTLIKENYSNRLLIKETEFKALQAQINPHFLYNTLESINWIARVNRQTQISQMVESLAFLLRNSIDPKEPILRLSEELDIVRSYITIQKYRFEDRLDFAMDVPDEVMNRPIPKLTIQPLLENAIHYALEPSVGVCAIRIRAWETEQTLFVAVEDSGPGMPEDLLGKLRAGGWKTNGKGIGLLNIEDRIKLAFGEAYGIDIEGGADGGARVVLRLPGSTDYERL